MARGLANPTGEAVSIKNKQADKRAAIIEAATELFTTEGYETTTIAEVAKKAGVAVGTVYLYFKNKQEILYSVKDDWEADFAQLMAATNLNTVPHQHRIRPLIEACFRVCEEHVDRIQLMGLPPQVVGEIHKGGAFIKQSSPAMLQAIQAWFEQAIHDGVFRPMDTGTGAALSYGLVTTALDYCYNVEGGDTKQQYIDTLVDMVQRWVLRPEYLEQV